MSTIAVELPDELREFIETKVQRGEFASAGEYIVALVEAARRKKSEIEVALLEGLASGPAQEWTRAEWDDMKKRVVERHSGEVVRILHGARDLDMELKGT